MGTRLQFQTLLKGLVENVYFQPPENVKIVYPCIVYTIDKVDTKFAGNLPYKSKKAYLVTAISKDPDSDIPDKLGMFPMNRFVRAFASDNLNHVIYRIYF